MKFVNITIEWRYFTMNVHVYSYLPKCVILSTQHILITRIEPLGGSSVAASVLGSAPNENSIHVTTVDQFMQFYQ